MKYIDAEKLKALLEQRKKQLAQWTDKEYANQRIDEIDCILDVDIDSLQQDQPEVDIEQELYKHFGQVKDFTLGMRIGKYFYELGRKQVLQEIYDGKTKPVDKITAAWLDDKEEDK